MPPVGDLFRLEGDLSRITGDFAIDVAAATLL